MKALILSGGFGTRLRPLTLSKPKPLIEFGDKSIIEHQIEALTNVGVSEIILAISHQPDAMIEYMKSVEAKNKVKITFSIEETPLGTGGPLKLAEKQILENNHDGLFFVLNADVICPFPFKQMIEVHKEKKAEATMVLTKVDDPSKYGVVVTNDEGRALQFVEKPSTFVGDRINAGLYLLSTSLLNKINLEPTSLEREIFPMIAKEGGLYTMDLIGFWMDVGQPKDYLQGLKLWQQYQKEGKDDKQAIGDNIEGNVMILGKTIVHPNTKIGPNVVIGEGCIIEEGVRLMNATVLAGSKIGSHSLIKDSIIGWRGNIGKWVRIENFSVFGEDVGIKDELLINGTIVLSHKVIAADYPEKGHVVM